MARLTVIAESAEMRIVTPMTGIAVLRNLGIQPDVTGVAFVAREAVMRAR